MDERNGGIRLPRRPSRRQPAPGRRSTDWDPRTTITRKMVVITIILVDAFYLAGETLIYGNNVCP